jgi:hypothetical protein
MNYAGPLAPIAAFTYGLMGFVGILVLMACWMIAINLVNRFVRGKAHTPAEPTQAASEAPAADPASIADGR